jgi:hypothetical protein
MKLYIKISIHKNNYDLYSIILYFYLFTKNQLLFMTKLKFLIKVIDMMGRTTELTPNKLLIMCYDDGSTEKVMITE